MIKIKLNDLNLLFLRKGLLVAHYVDQGDLNFTYICLSLLPSAGIKGFLIPAFFFNLLERQTIYKYNEALNVYTKWSSNFILEFILRK